MTAITRQISNGSFQSTKSNQSLIYTGSPNSSCGGGILANAHEAPKKPIKPADSGFTSALKAAFIPPQPGKQRKHNGKPLGKSFERTSPLPTKGHDGGEVLKHDPRGEHAKVGDGIVLSNGFEGEEEIDESPSWTPLTATSSASSAGEVQSQDGSWSDLSASRGRSSTMASNGTTGTGSSRSMSRSSGSSSSNPCKIKFCPLPSSGRLKRANSITIGVAARSHLLQSQGSARANNGSSNAAAWQAAQAASQRGNSSTGTEQAQNVVDLPKREAVLRHGDTVDLGDELRKGVMKAFRKMRKGGSVSEGGGEGGVERPAVKDLEGLKSVDGYAEGELTPKRSSSPTRTSSFPPKPENGHEESDGTRTPRQRRISTGAFTGHNAFMEIEENRTKAIRGELDDEREEVAQFSQALGRTHATTVAHHTRDDSWHPGMLLQSLGLGKTDSVDAGQQEEEAELEEEVYENAHDDNDPESVEAERLADEALKSHSEKATKAGAIEKMERHH